MLIFTGKPLPGYGILAAGGMSMDVREQKRALRAEIKKRAGLLDETYRRPADERILAAVTGWELWRRARSVFIYVSVDWEPDTRHLIAAALAEGKRVYVPRCCGRGQMHALRILSQDQLSPGAFGIPEPPEDAEPAPSDIDLTLAPCVTVSPTGARLGHGAGYYDRFLAGHYTVCACLCHGALLTAEIPVDEYDRPMDYVITERGIIKTH